MNKYLDEVFLLLVLCTVTPFVFGFYSINNELTVDYLRYFPIIAEVKDIFFLLMGVSLFVLALYKKELIFYFCCLSPFIGGSINYDIFNPDIKSSSQDVIVFLIYTFATGLNFLFFLVYGRIKSLSFFLFVGFIFAGQYISISDNDGHPLDYFFDRYNLSFSVAFFCLMIIGFLRFLILIFQENFDIIKQFLNGKKYILETDEQIKKAEELARRESNSYTLVCKTVNGRLVSFLQEKPGNKRRLELLKINLHAMYLWSPMIIIFVLASVFYGHWLSKLEGYTIEILVTEYWSGSKKGVPSDYENLQSALDATLENNLHALQVEADTFLEEIDKDINTGADMLPGFIDSKYDKFLPKAFPGTEHLDKCSFLNIPCYIKNKIKRAINNAYLNVRRSQRKELMEYNTKVAENTKIGSEEKINLMRKSLTGHVNKLIRYSKVSIETIFLISHWFGLIMFALSLWILINSYMVVFARVFLSKNSSTIFKDKNLMPASSDIKSHDSKYIIHESSRETYFVSRRLTLNNHSRNFSVPMPGKSIIGRIIHGVYIFDRIDLNSRSRSDGDVYVNIKQPGQLIEWDLKNNEEIMALREFPWKPLHVVS
jgi:hypothetical protein